ncbi:DsbA family protein [Candidatus Gottesmanbacteria bacterium]|nr:DsbA family protein [Candidatus Gottesmanbacteria bacterium]
MKLKELGIVLAVFVVGLAVGGMFVKIQYLEGKVAGTQTAAAQPSAPGQQPSAPQGPTTVDVKVTADDPVKGSPNAKLTIVEFSDFQCPFCGRFFKETEPQIFKEYVDTGKAKFVYKNLAFLGKESIDAANAALCAKEQNKFWEYHDKLFTSQNGENQGAFAIANLKKFAVDLGLNAVSFNDCLDKQKYNAQVTADNAEANKNGFQSTPSVAVGVTPIIGAQTKLGAGETVLKTSGHFSRWRLASSKIVSLIMPLIFPDFTQPRSLPEPPPGE